MQITHDRNLIPISNKPNDKRKNIKFKGPLDGAITQSLVAIDTNPMVNAALVDVFSMVIPRTYVDTKKRNKYAGAETLFRELTGTFIVCLSSGILAKGIAHLYNKYSDKSTKVNPNSWVSDDSLNLLHNVWQKSKNTPEKYAENILKNISGQDGRTVSKWGAIDWEKTEWTNDSKWEKFKWQNKKFENIHNKLISEKEISKTIGDLISNQYDKKDTNQVLEIIHSRITNALKVGNAIEVKVDDKTLSTSLHNLLRDSYDLGKNVFTNKNVNIEAAINKLTKMNKVKTLGALSIASILGLTNQYINRQITKKRTGTDNFVGDLDYQEQGADKKQENKTSNANLFAKKLIASAGIIGLAAAVMKIKSPKDFIKKLEFTSAITSGNAIKTVYTATLVGRFLASKNETELRETSIRDYLGFLNWLVFGGFVAKGVANSLDKGQNNLFNINKEGKGLKHWLNDISLKSHAEIAAKGNTFAKKNIWKLNIAHASGLVYSTVALGFLLPLLNIVITKQKGKKKNIIKPEITFDTKLQPHKTPSAFKGVKS